MHKLEDNRSTIFQKQLIFINIFFQYNSLSAPCTQLQGSAHTTMDSTRPLRTQLQSLYPYTNTLDSDLQMQIILSSQNHNTKIQDNDFSKKLTSSHKALLYLYIPMVYKPWVGWISSYYFTLSLGGQPFDLTHYNSRSVHFGRSLPFFFPKLWTLSHKTVMRGLRYPTGP